MRDSQHGGQGERGTTGVSGLARSVLSRLLENKAERTREPAYQLTMALARAISAMDAGEFRALRADLRRRRIGDEELVDRFFPAVARQLGCDWLGDRASFAEVSVGLARMQAILHEVSRGRAAHEVDAEGRDTVLLLLPEGEQHSFGALLLASQLRRRGVSVQLMLGARLQEIEALMQHRNVDAVLLSLACEENLELCRLLVNALRKALGPDVPLVVGGAVLERPVDVRAITGADLVTSDLDEAIAALRSRSRQQGARAE